MLTPQITIDQIQRLDGDGHLDHEDFERHMHPHHYSVKSHLNYLVQVSHYRYGMTPLAVAENIDIMYKAQYPAAPEFTEVENETPVPEIWITIDSEHMLDALGENLKYPARLSDDITVHSLQGLSRYSAIAIYPVKVRLV